MTSQELEKDFEILIKEFVEFRKTHGGILLPDEVIIDGCFNQAMWKVFTKRRPKEVHIIGSNK